ncbi:ATP-dependent helicase [Achlya hypogyna]|uniref:ATP-dependent helicase n=1 Tax=Achlya hypogyna TaxID=1202772 RepID=A0A1V9YP31_ACHHY|nr:ATP-dependent helicase [Achlya hypogyna]
MAAIKELRTGKVVGFVDKEIPVCGGRGVVHLRKDGQLELRCRGATSLIVNQAQGKQAVVKNGSSQLLALKDVFFANGTLLQYTVVEAPPSLGQPQPEPTVVKKRTPPATVEPPVKVQRTRADSIDSSDNDEYIVPKKAPRRTNTVVVDSEDEAADSTTEESSPVHGKADRDEVESIDDEEEDDVFAVEAKAAPPKPSIFEKFSFAKGGDDNGWITAPRLRKLATDEWTAKKMTALKKPTPKPRKPRKRVVASSSEEEDEAESASDSDGLDESEVGQRPASKRSQQDEVAGILQTCAALAEELRTSVSQWSSATIADETALVAVDAGVQFVQTRDIPGLSPTLELQPYQVVGVNWLYLLYQHKMSAVLADEMGLGKTVQTIAFLALLCAKGCGPHFVIVPASTLSNWVRELGRFAPALRVVTYHGAKEDRQALQADRSSVDVLLTTYSYFERDTCGDDRAFFCKFSFGYVVLDEGHSIKNAKTSRFKRIAAVRAKHRLVLSGTPIQNNLSELLSLLSFLMPTIFNHGSEQMMDFFAGEPQGATCTKIRHILGPFILRRLKKNVLLQMVPKTEHTHVLTLPPAQRAVYDELVAAAVAAKDGDKAKAAARKAGGHRGAKREVRALLNLEANIFDGQNDAAIFTQLRKAANHPILLRHHFRSPEKMDTLGAQLYQLGAFGNQCTRAMVDKEIESYSDFDLHELCAQYGDVSPELRALQLPVATLLDSVKFDHLRALLPPLHADGHRVLIFSQWTKLLDLIEVLMAHLGFKFLRLDGSTNVADRQAMIDEFNDDTTIFAFLLSTRAGGLGINLTAADTVILHDLDFNPTLDAQACDRCHRIGQTKPVTVHKLVANDTVDHSIYLIAEQKTQLNDAVLGELGRPKKTSKASGSAADVQAILSSVLSSYSAKVAN